MLTPALARFHSTRSGAVATGVFRIVRAHGFIRNICSWIMHLPPAGKRVFVRLEVIERKYGEQWVRDFSGHRLVTKQWIRNGLLIESSGPFRFGFRLSVEDKTLKFRMARCWMLGIPLPLPLAPRVTADITGREASWRTVVEVGAPFVGPLVRYEGEMVPEC